MRKTFIIISTLIVLLILVWAYFWIDALFAFFLVGPFLYMGFADILQRQQSIRRNFPVLGRLRYVFEDLRPKIQQYFVESDTDGAPINRNDRSVIYQRAKKQIDTTPFGTQLNVYSEGYEWMSHSIIPLDFHTIDHHPLSMLATNARPSNNGIPTKFENSGGAAPVPPSPPSTVIKSG